VYVAHRLEVVRRRSEYRRRRAAERLHLVVGLLTAIVDIDEVIQLIRGSDDAAQARARLMEVFELSEIQANYILDMPLRRLTKFSRIELEAERDTLRQTIEELSAILDDEAVLRKLVSTELADVAKQFATPRRTVLLESAGQPTATVALEITDDPVHVLLSSTGLLARTTDDAPLPTTGSRAKHDVVLSAIRATARGDVGVVTSRGRILRLGALDLPALPATAAAPNLAGGAPVTEFLDLQPGEQVLALTTLDPQSVGLALGTATGVVKRVTPDHPSNKDTWDVISLKPGDRVVGAVELTTGDEDLVFVTGQAQLLRFGAGSVRPQGRAAGGMAGVKLGAADSVVFFGAIHPEDDAVVVTVSGSSAALPGTDAGSVKVTPYAEYPSKGRATSGVRCHRFLRGEDVVQLAWAGRGPARAAAATGVPLDLPEPLGKRDGSGTALAQPVAAVGGPVVGTTDA